MLARATFRLLGWKLSGQAPADHKFLLIAAPHTSNWDFPFYLLLAAAYGIRMSWMGKRSLFRGPQGPVMRALGGIPVDREARRDMVGEMTSAFAAQERLVVALLPEGTRRHTDHWKSGFYHIAQRADVPLTLCYLDFRRRQGSISESFRVSGDREADMERIRAFYQGVMGRRPERGSTIRLRPL